VARRAKKKKSGPPLGLWIFLICSLLILLTAGSAILVTWIFGNRFARQTVEENLSGSHAAQGALQQQRYRQLLLISRILRTDQVLVSYLAAAPREDQQVAILDAIEEYQNLLDFDLAVVLDREGRVLRRTDDRDALGEDLSASPLVATALAEGEAFGVWQQHGELYHAVAVRLARQFELVGSIVVAFAINDALALQIQRTSGAHTVFLANSPTGPTVTAATLDPALSAELIPELRRRGEVLNRVTQRGETVDRLELSLAGRPWTAFLAPLHDAAKEAGGAVVALASREGALESFRRILLVLTAIGAVSLAIGLLLSLHLAGRTLRPVRLMAAAAEQAAGGHPPAELPAAGGEVGRLADSLAQLLAAMREKLALEHFLSRVARFLPEPAKGRSLAPPRSSKAALVAVEMRRFANPRLAYDPEENLGRLGRDLKRVSAAVESRGGRLEAVHGHRALAVFDADDAAFQALCAATEILLSLSERENVFDEPEPPVVAVTSGTVITGTVRGGDPPVAGVAGLPVQQLESLVREAVAGEIYLSKQIHGELAELFQRTGVVVPPQRGLVSPQPLFSLSPELAGRLTGIASAPQAGGYSDPRGGLAHLEQGVVLGGRFELLAELEASPMGQVWKARDRELGDLVTLKMLKREFVADAARFEWLRSFIQRARTIRHPNLLAVLDFGEVDEMPYITSEFERGMTLRQVLDHSRQIPVAAGLRMGRQIAEGLAAAHGQGLLHLGLRPENVLLEARGNARLMDLGLALPATGTVQGVAYLAPEQLAGREVDPRADVYGLGAVLYELFTGRPPYAGSTADELRRRQQAEDLRPPGALCEMPQPLEATILRCLARAPEERWASAAEVATALGQVRV
jgi:serine/threonine-protein kinase